MPTSFLEKNKTAYEKNKTAVLSCKVKLDGNLGRMLSASTPKFAMQDFLEFPSALENQSLLKCQ